MNKPIGIPSGWEVSCAFYWQGVPVTGRDQQVCNIIWDTKRAGDWSSYDAAKDFDWRVEP